MFYFCQHLDNPFSRIFLFPNNEKLLPILINLSRLHGTRENLKTIRPLEPREGFRYNDQWIKYKRRAISLNSKGGGVGNNSQNNCSTRPWRFFTTEPWNLRNSANHGRSWFRANKLVPANSITKLSRKLNHAGGQQRRSLFLARSLVVNNASSWALMSMFTRRFTCIFDD